MILIQVLNEAMNRLHFVSQGFPLGGRRRFGETRDKRNWFLCFMQTVASDRLLSFRS